MSLNYSATEISELLENPDSITVELALKILEFGNFEEKWSIAKILVKYGESIIPILKPIVLDENADREYRWYALKILSELQNPSIILMVTQLLEITEDEDLITLATQTLANQGNKAISLLSELLEFPEYRLLAVKALAQIPNAKVIQPLLSVVADEDQEIRLIVIATLGKFDKPEILPILSNALNDHVSAIRKEALNGLGLRKKYPQETDLVKLISPLLNDVNLTVCQQAALSLSRLKSDRAASALFTPLKSSNTPLPLQIHLVRALAWMEIPSSIDYLAQSLFFVNDATILEIITLFGMMSDYEHKSKLIAILLNFYHSNNLATQEPEILQALCYSWQKLNAIEAVAILKEIANHQNEAVRYHAQFALKELQTMKYEQ